MATAFLDILGMFLGGFVFGRLSDKFGRRPMLMITTLFNFFGYLLIVYSPLFWIFLVGRFIWGLGGAGIGIVQAYVSDISSKENRTIRLGFIGAMFGLGFLIGPAIGGLLASFGNHFVGYAGAFFVFLNFLLVTLFLPESKRHIPAEGEIKTEKNSFGVPKEIVLLLVVSFLATIAFSPIQAISGLFYSDVFGFDAVAYSHDHAWPRSCRSSRYRVWAARREIGSKIIPLRNTTTKQLVVFCRKISVNFPFFSYTIQRYCNVIVLTITFVTSVIYASSSAIHIQQSWTKCLSSCDHAWKRASMTWSLWPAAYIPATFSDNPGVAYACPGKHRRLSTPR